MLNCRTVSRAALVPVLITVGHCSCSRNLFLPSLLFPSTLFLIYCFLPDIFLSLHQFFCVLPFSSSSLAQWNFACATSISHFSRLGSFQWALCKWRTERVVCKLQLVKQRGCKKTVCERPLKGQCKIWITSAWERVCCYLPVCWRSAYSWLLLIWIDTIIFWLPDMGKERGKIFLS